MPTFRIYGNSDDTDEGFKSAKEVQHFIREGIFTESDRRYRYSETYFADKMILSFDGYAYGHFDISGEEAPTPEDMLAYKRTKRVFHVERSTLYETPVDLHQKDSPESGPDSFRFHVRQRGLEITREDFDRIVAAAGTTESFPKLDARYCRICYNSNGWRRPTGTADEVTESYYAKHGFGHEEWLFNYEWCIDGYKYGFLQPFNNAPGHRGNWFSLKLFTNLGGKSFLAGTISKVYAPHADELKLVYDRMLAEGWIEQMKTDVRALSQGDVAELEKTTSPELFINVRFRSEDVVLSDDMPEFPPGSKPRTADRYKLMHDKDGVWLPDATEPTDPEDPATLRTIRAAQPETTVDLAHRRLQFKLKQWLCSKHGAPAVKMELEDVDLRVTLPGGTTFYEIKTATSAKKCIREAMGQLFEYAAYSNSMKAKTWVVVGDPAPTAEDITYLAHLRGTFNLPLYYAQFDWETCSLRDCV